MKNSDCQTQQNLPKITTDKLHLQKLQNILHSFFIKD